MSTAEKAVEIRAPVTSVVDQLLTPDALAFLAMLHRQFEPRRRALLQRRAERQQALDGGATPGFLPETQHVRDGEWKIGAIPKDLRCRRVEITGPCERKMMINALNSGADLYMTDFEDSITPTWTNVIE